jgi:Fic family protein
MNNGNYQKYIWQQKEWPNWTFDTASLSATLVQVHLERGRLFGSMDALGFKLAEEVSLAALTSEVVKSSEIEGEKLNPESVRSSIARRLGIEDAGLVASDKNIDGVVEMVLDATRQYSSPLSEKRLFGWHAALFPTGYSGLHKIAVAEYRNDSDGPMQVISGAIGREKVHYEAPSASVLKSEMAYFLYWLNDSNTAVDPVIKAGLAHLWLVTLHPFEDGNGRIGRAVCDMALARADGSAQRFYSLSSQMLSEREDYYTNLEYAQKSTLDATDWLEWFLGCLHRALLNANEEIKGALQLSRLANNAPSGSLNPRQIKMLNKLMSNFEGKLTTGKWALMNKCSTDTALRDIEELVAAGALMKAGESKRGTHYLLKLD